MNETCRHCGLRIQVCNCGANGGQPHWIDATDHPRHEFTSRWCPDSKHTHSPATKETNRA